MKVFEIMRRSAAILSEAAFPGTCCDCGRLFLLRREPPPVADYFPIDDLFKKVMGACVCPGCAERFSPVHSPLCTRCGHPFASPHGPDHECGQCSRHPFHFHAARSVGLYEGVLRAAIHALKFQGREQLAAPLGHLMWQTLIQTWTPDAWDRIIPVPLHPRRMRERGFNQASLLVRKWPEYAARSGLGKESGWIDPYVLKRHRATMPQTGLLKEQRTTNLRNAFKVVDEEAVRNKHVLLVDDVMTTGTTAESCALSLLNAGAAEVRVLTLARAVL